MYLVLAQKTMRLEPLLLLLLLPLWVVVGRVEKTWGLELKLISNEKEGAVKKLP